jgi:hypothetical protein
VQNNPKGLATGVCGDDNGVNKEGEFAFIKSISSSLFLRALTLLGGALFNLTLTFGSTFFLFNLNTFNLKHA